MSRPTLRGEGRARTLTAADLAQLPERLDSRVPYPEGRARGYTWRDVSSWPFWREAGRRFVVEFEDGRTVADLARAVRAARGGS